VLRFEARFEVFDFILISGDARRGADESWKSFVENLRNLKQKNFIWKKIIQKIFKIIQKNLKKNQIFGESSIIFEIHENVKNYSKFLK